MPILDQGYQHWDGSLAGHAWRWLAVTRQGIRAQLNNRNVRYITLASWLPALVLAAFLVVWGLFEQKSALLTPFLMLLQNLPDELKEGPRGYRTTIWTIAFSLFFEVQLFLTMILVSQVGPDLISQDLRSNAIPLYLSRPLRRIDYFLGKLGVIAAFLSTAMILPILVAFGLGVAFSLDPGILGDTARILGASLAFGLIVVLSAGPLMLAISSLSRNSRSVSAIWLALWIVGNLTATTLSQSLHRRWCPLVSYTADLANVRDAMLDTPSAWSRVTSLFEAGKDGLKQAGGFGPRFARQKQRAIAGRSTVTGDDPNKPPWTWAAGVLLGLFVLSLAILSTRVRSLDRAH